MLEKLIVRNYQCHKRLSLELDPGVNTIVGPSDAGKSAILRALIWLTTNKPRGSAFIKKDTQRAQVILRVSGNKIKRTRGQKNTYELNGSTFTAFGNDVPAEIASVLNVSELNFQGQHDSAFWFSQSPGEVSRQLNAIVDLSVIDSTLSNLSSALRKARIQESVVEKRLEEAREERRNLRTANRADRALKGVEEAEEVWASERLRASLLNDLIEQGSQAEERALSLPAGVSRGLRKLERQAKGLKDLAQQESHLSNRIRFYQEYKKLRVERSQEHSRLEEEITELMGETCPLCQQPIRS